MLNKSLVTLVVSTLVILVASNDVSIGQATPYSKKIYGAIKQANPALWKRRDNIMIDAPNQEYISAVYVTDLRSDKEGEAYIAAGGIGSKSVTIALKSPSVLTGYKFSIEVFAENINTFNGNVRSPYYSGLSGVGHVGYPSSSVSYPIGNSYNSQYPGYSHYQIIGG